MEQANTLQVRFPSKSLLRLGPSLFSPSFLACSLDGWEALGQSQEVREQTGKDPGGLGRADRQGNRSIQICGTLLCPIKEGSIATCDNIEET